MLVLLLKAIDKRDSHTMALFDAPVLVDAYTRKDGTTVATHVARRKHALHPAKPRTVVHSDSQLLLLPVKASAKPNHTVAAPLQNGGMEHATAPITAPVAADSASTYGPPNKRDVPEHLLPQVEAIIAKVNKRAAKLGVDGFTLVKGEPFEKQLRTEPGEPRRFVHVIPCTIEGPAIKAPGGWSLAGRVDFEDGSTIVNSKPGSELPKRFRAIRPFCDHCRSDRQRNAVFVFKREADDYMQVGRSCLKDYLGHDPAAALWAASEFGGVFDDIDRELDEGGGSRSQLVDMGEVMEAAAWAVRKFGFLSAKLAEDKGLLPTSAEVSAALFDRKYRADYLKDITKEDKDKAAAVVAWVQAQWAGKEDASDYEYNAAELTGRRSVHARRVGLLTSLVAAYDRAMAADVERKATVNAHVGKVGERRSFDAVFAGSNSFDTAYGVMWVGRFQTPEGLLVYKGSAPFWPTHLKAGDSITFTGTIKEHADYKGTKQTLVQRCSMPKAK